VCHQTVGLIARQLEAAGIPTTSVSSARDITCAVRPPRAAFVDFPLGHTTGHVGHPYLTKAIIESAFDLLSVTEGEVVRDLGHQWPDGDAWKDTDFLPELNEATGKTEMVDDRVERHATPQYQTKADEAAAVISHGDQECLVCAGIDY